MASFLEIPQELRNKILELAINTDTAPPQYANVDNAAEYKELDDIVYQSWTNGKDVLYPQSSIPSNALSLLLVSRSMQAQSLAALARLKCSSTFKMDVLLVQESELWATWTSHRPIFTPNVETIHVSFRILPMIKEDPGGRSHAFRGGNGGPPIIFWHLYTLLERSLRCGPVMVPIKREKGFRAIQWLDLDVLTPSNISEEQKRLEQPGKLFHVLPPRKWMAIIRQGIAIILRMSRDSFPMGRVLYERVGKIRLMRDGEVQIEFDLANLLSEMRYHPGNDSAYPKSSVAWWDKVKSIYGKRMAAGLPCALEPWKNEPEH
jgi:hypothetical protein